MTTVVKYVGNGAIINGLPARDLTEADWEVIGTQGRQHEVLNSPLYKVVNNEIEMPVPEPETTPVPVIGDGIEATLKLAGYETVEAVQAATDEELLAIEGIGPARLAKIREALA